MATHSSILRRSLALAAVCLGVLPVAASTVEPQLLSGLVWRNVGPFRGGRVSAVTGVIGQPGVFYMGLPLGGVWKTTSAGETWFPIFDDVKEASSVGAIQVAPSDPNVIYVGMGDLITGGGINEGNGVYKSTDAGKTWTHLGLDDTRQIPSILVDPKNPNLVLLAAQGNIHTETEMRGVFRSTDGGKTWTKTLYVDNHTGLQEIAWAFDRPDVMLATTVRHYTAPGAAGRAGGAPPATPPPAGQPAAPPVPSGTNLFKSTDEGLTWKEITGSGLPALAGRTSIAIAMNTGAQRMFLIGNFGLYRSDDGGGSWRQMAADDTRIRNGQNGYNCGVYVDPKNPDLVYTINTSSFKSVDGGVHFDAFKGAPGGDDPQQMWIDPTDGQRLFLGVDQGATISLDGGRTWSSWYNQATAQVYHISTDNQFPYWIYATQQDSGSIATRNRGDLGAVTNLDWLPHPGYEFGYIVADPLNPRVTYAGGPNAGIIRTTYPSGQWINVSPNVDTSLALRKVTNQPLVWSPQDPHELMAGFQYVMATTDAGLHWKKLSPDLGYPKGVTPPPPGTTPAAGRGAGPGAPPAGGSIESLSPSTVTPGLIWVGTNNGLIKLTKDHGLHWDDVTIPNLPNPTRADISTIEASHHDPATAYAAIDLHTTGDYKPYLYRTKDYGKTWTPIAKGLAVDQPSGSFARVIRADTKKAGLLFAGTESSMYVSFDDGDSWQSLMLNLPNTSYRDIAIHENDLVVGTYGRSFWILDDYSPLREMTAATSAEPAHLFKPGSAIRVRRNVNGDTPFPPELPHAVNPPPGALIYYSLGARPAGRVALEILDAAGKVVRHLSSDPIPPLGEPPPVLPDYWLEKPMPMPAAIGTNRVNWNIRYDSPPAFSHSFQINANYGETPASPEGPLALPGIYTVKLTVDGKSYTQTVTVKNDPRSPATSLDLATQHTLQMKVYDAVKLAWDGYRQVAAVRAALPDGGKIHLAAEVSAAVEPFSAKLLALAGNPAAGRGRGGGGGGGAAGGPPPPPTFVSLNAAFVRQLETLDSGDSTPTESMRKAYATSCTDLAKAIATWKDLNGKELTAVNATLSANKLPVVTAAPAPTAPVCATTAPAATTPATGRGRGER